MSTHPFPDLASGAPCMLVIAPGRAAAVAHPGCAVLADLVLALDAFYCRSCRYSGRISGAWALDMIRAAELERGASGG